jgi:formylmethanofuran dehydrogenase subunit E
MNKIDREWEKDWEQEYFKLTFELDKATSTERDRLVKRFVTQSITQAVLNERKRILEAVEEAKRTIIHPTLRYKGKICDACSEDFIHNRALEIIKEIVKQNDK